eukprot:4533329-Alexandrium_andersonii.AAC.1
MELPRFWRTVLNGEKEPIAIEGHVAIAMAHLGSFLQCSGRKGVFIRQIRDHRDPAAEVVWAKKHQEEAFKAYYARAPGPPWRRESAAQ